MKISNFCIQRPVFSLVINLLIVLAGIMAFRALTVREYPNITTPIVNIQTFYPGASAEIVESEITRPMEDAIAGIEGIDYISSVTRDEGSEITVHFKPERDINEATNDIRDNVGRVKSNLPTQATQPIIAKVEADANPIIWLAFSSDHYSLMEMSEYAERFIKDKLEILPGVASVYMAGERQPAMRIWIDPARLASHSLTIQDVTNALKRQNLAVPSGRVESEALEFTVYSKTDLETENEFKDIILRDDEGYLLRLGDIAQIEVGPRHERFLARYNGKPALGLGIIKQSTANPLDIANALQAALPALKANLPTGLKMELAFDSTTVIKDSIQAVYKSIFEAIALVVIIIFLFLRSVRATTIPIVTIPISLIGGFALILLFGFSINVLTLLAMVLAIGLVVDDAIVVLENIYRHIENDLPPLIAAQKGMQEIGTALIAMTLTLAAVFVPVAFTQGKIGKLFTEFAVVLAGTVIISGFTALTLTPMMCAKWLKPHQQHGKFYNAIEIVLQKLTLGYQKWLDRCLRYRYWILGLLIVILGLNYFLFIHLKSEMAPQEDRGFIMTMGMAPEGSSIDYTLQNGLKIENLLKQQPDVLNNFLVVGWPNVQQVFTFTLLKDRDERQGTQQDLVNTLNGQLYQIPGLLAFAINPSSSLEDDSGFTPVAVVIQYPGPYQQLKELSEKILAKARTNPMLQNLDMDLKLNKPQFDLHINREKAAQSGISVDTIAESLQILFAGQDVTQFKRASKKYDVMVQAQRNLRSSPTDLLAVLVRAKDGSMLPLSNFVEFQETTAASGLMRFNKLPAVTITASIAPGFSLDEALTYLEDTIHEVAQESVQIDYTGTSRMFKQTGKALYLIFVLALVVVFLVLAAQFESFINPFIIMFSVPLGVMGALLTLNLVGGTLNVFSQIGLIALVGLITKHGILLVEFSNQLQQQGKDIHEAIIQAASLRLRPILMTTAAMVLGSIPLAFATGAGSEGRQQIGWAIVGGMTIGTILTLFVVPVVYRFLAKKNPRDISARKDSDEGKEKIAVKCD